MQISQKPPQRHWDGAREPAVLTCSQAMLMLLVLGAHLRTTSFKGWEARDRVDCLVDHLGYSYCCTLRTLSWMVFELSGGPGQPSKCIKAQAEVNMGMSKTRPTSSKRV